MSYTANIKHPLSVKYKARNKSYFKYLLSLFLFGSNGIVASHIVLTSHQVVFWRTMLGSALLFILFIFSKRNFTFFKYKKESFYLAASGMALGISWLFLFEAYKRIGVSISTIAYYLGPVIVMILSPLIFKEKLTKSKVLGFAVVISGVVLVNFKSGGNFADSWGLFCGFMSACMYSLMIIFSKKVKSIKGLENSMIQLISSFLIVAVFIIIKHDFTVTISLENIIPIVILGFVNTGIGCYLYFSAINNLPVQTVAICGYLEPLSAVVFSVIFLNESMSMMQTIGAFMVLGGAAFGELHKKS